MQTFVWWIQNSKDSTISTATNIIKTKKHETEQRNGTIITDSANGTTRTKTDGVCQITVGDEVGNHRKVSSHARLWQAKKFGLNLVENDEALRKCTWRRGLFYIINFGF